MEKEKDIITRLNEFEFEDYVWWDLLRDEFRQLPHFHDMVREGGHPLRFTLALRNEQGVEQKVMLQMTLKEEL